MKKDRIPDRVLVERAVRRAFLAVRSATRNGEFDDLHRILAAGYAAAMLVQNESALEDLARGLRVLAARPSPLRSARENPVVH